MGPSIPLSLSLSTPSISSITSEKLAQSRFSHSLQLSYLLLLVVNGLTIHLQSMGRGCNRRQCWCVQVAYVIRPMPTSGEGDISMERRGRLLQIKLINVMGNIILKVYRESFQLWSQVTNRYFDTRYEQYIISSQQISIQLRKDDEVWNEEQKRLHLRT